MISYLENFDGKYIILKKAMYEANKSMNKPLTISQYSTNWILIYPGLSNYILELWKGGFRTRQAFNTYRDRTREQRRGMCMARAHDITKNQRRRHGNLQKRIPWNHERGATGHNRYSAIEILFGGMQCTIDVPFWSCTSSWHQGWVCHWPVGNQPRFDYIMMNDIDEGGKHMFIAWGMQEQDTMLQMNRQIGETEHPLHWSFILVQQNKTPFGWRQHISI